MGLSYFLAAIVACLENCCWLFLFVALLSALQDFVPSVAHWWGGLERLVGGVEKICPPQGCLCASLLFALQASLLGFQITSLLARLPAPPLHLRCTHTIKTPLSVSSNVAVGGACVFLSLLEGQK